MADSQSKTSKVAKSLFSPIAHAAITAGTAYLTRKAMRLWQEKLQPKIERRGVRTVAKETVQDVAEKAGVSSSSSSEASRRQRKQRRTQRRKALEKSGSS